MSMKIRSLYFSHQHQPLGCGTTSNVIQMLLKRDRKYNK